MSRIVMGKLTSTVGESDYAGHRVSLEFTERVEIPASEDLHAGEAKPQAVWSPAARSASLRGDGSFQLEVPTADGIKSPIRFMVRAPDGSLLLQEGLGSDDLNHEILRKVNPRIALPVESHPDKFKSQRTKVTGRIIHPGTCKLPGCVQILIWARAEGAAEADFRVVLVARAERSGYFSGLYPRGPFAEAFGQISTQPAVRVPIPLLEGELPPQIVLVLDASVTDSGTGGSPGIGSLANRGTDLAGHQGCSCEGGDNLEPPDPIDLVNSPGSYSGQVGGGRCVDFTAPNRTLEEFSYYKILRTTDPEIRGLTLEEPKKLPPVVLGRLLDISVKGTLFQALSETQAASTAPASVSPDSSSLVRGAAAKMLLMGGLKGEAGIPDAKELASSIKALKRQGIRVRPEILKSIATDPENFTPEHLMTAERHSAFDYLHNLVNLLGRKVPGRADLNGENPVDWDDTPTFYQATTIAHGHLLHFKQVWRADGYSLGDLLYSLPLAPAQKKQIAIVDWERRESAARTEQETADEAMMASLSRDRDISEIVTGAAHESIRAGSNASTSSWAAGGGIGLALGPLVIGGGGGGGGSSASSTSWQDSARNVTGTSLQQLRDTTLQAASAVRSRRATVVQTARQGETIRVQTEVVANHNHCHAMTVEYFEVLRHFLISQELADVQECLFVPLLMTRFDLPKALRWRESLGRWLRDRRLSGGFESLERIELNYAGSDFPLRTFAEEQVQYLDGELRVAFTIARPRDPQQDENVFNYINDVWPFWVGLLGGNPMDVYNSHLKLQDARDRIWREQLAPRVAEAFVSALKVWLVDEAGVEHPVDLDPTLVSDYREGVSLYVRLNNRGGLPGLRRDRIKGVVVRTTHELPAGSKVIVHGAHFRYRTAHLNHHLVNNGRVMNDLTVGDDVYLSTPLDAAELRNPRREDQELAQRLLKHLNENLEYYHRIVWMSMDSNRRFMLLDGYLAPNSGGRSVASVVENRLIGIIGNCLVLPVARGFNLDPTYRKGESEAADLLDVYAPLTPLPPARVSVPTRGVFAEAVLGSCNSCEVKDESRFWRWEESPSPDEPAAIQSPSTESRRSDPPSLQTQGFPSPIIAMQNAPTAPDPTGLGAALQVLGNSNLFRDATGLTQNQKNALAALQGAFGLAQGFGTQALTGATNLALQRAMQRDVDKALQTIQEARKNNMIDDAQVSTLTENAIRGLVGSGPQREPSTMTQSEISELANTAGNNEANVRVSRPTGEQVEVDARRGESLEDSTRTTILLQSHRGGPEARAFDPFRRDTSGVTELEAIVRNAPVGATFRWSPRDSTAIGVETPAAARTRVPALKPGLTEIDFSVTDSLGSTLASVRLPICVPQFVSIAEDAASFDLVLTTMNLVAQKSLVLAKAKEVCNLLLSTSNVRTIWRMAPFAEPLPVQVPVSNLTQVTLRGDPPTPGLLGSTQLPAGPAVFNEMIDIFPGGYDDLVGAGPSDVDVETRALVLQLQGAVASTPALNAFAVEVYGRLLGETLAHEIVHSLLGFDIPSGHNSPAIPNDLMNEGKDRTFRQRTGFEDLSHTSPIDPSNFRDHGVAAIGRLQAANQARMNVRFPVPPVFR